MRATPGAVSRIFGRWPGEETDEEIREALKEETMTAKHTPGPWHADIRSGCLAVYPEKQREYRNCLSCEDDDMIYYQMGRDPGQTYGIPSDEQIANARLIAAAPDLLAGMQGVYGMLDNLFAEYSSNNHSLRHTKLGRRLVDMQNVLRAAIAKAEDQK